MLFFVPLVSSHLTVTNEPSQPQQPSGGPGGSTVLHNGVHVSRYNSGAHMFWIFEPSDPTPVSAPLIVFNHGWSALFPVAYRMWIDHIVKRGNIVVFPRYQRGLYFGFEVFNANAIIAVKDAITILQSGNHVRPELDKFAIVGHSLGGGITANMAAQALDVGLPVPKAIMPVQPAEPLSGFADLQKISNTTLMLVIVGENDTVVGNGSAKNIFKNTTQIPVDQKDFVIQITDTYGSPDMVANHLAPLAFAYNLGDTVDAMDYYSTWKLFDALIDYAFYGTEKDFCLGDTPEQRFMGLWSDGTPVKELVVTDTP
jgi:pimeloyl-ACP methyl ester carboxylesterase